MHFAGVMTRVHILIGRHFLNVDKLYYLLGRRIRRRRKGYLLLKLKHLDYKIFFEETQNNIAKLYQEMHHTAKNAMRFNVET